VVTTDDSATHQQAVVWNHLNGADEKLLEVTPILTLNRHGQPKLRLSNMPPPSIGNTRDQIPRVDGTA
jgi:hypothetical protein